MSYEETLPFTYSARTSAFRAANPLDLATRVTTYGLELHHAPEGQGVYLMAPPGRRPRTRYLMELIRRHCFEQLPNGDLGLGQDLPEVSIWEYTAQGETFRYWTLRDHPVECDMTITDRGKELIGRYPNLSFWDIPVKVTPMSNREPTRSPETTPSRPLVLVDAQALKDVLAALNGPDHQIRELQHTRRLPGYNPINQLETDLQVGVGEVGPPPQPRLAQTLLEMLKREGVDRLTLEGLLTEIYGE